jgi:3-dehydroquinate dehydratase
MTLTQKDIELLEDSFATKEYLNQKLTELKSDLLNKLDSILKEILASRDEQTILAHRVSNHEDRLEKLEEIHPQGKHASL